METPGEKRKRDHGSDEGGDASEGTPEEHSGPDMSKYRFVKHTPQHPPSKPNDIYITSRSIKSVIVKRCIELLLSRKYPYVELHGLSAAVEMCADCALELRKISKGAWNLGPTTSTVPLVDEYEPIGPGKPISQVRLNSALHVKVYTAETPHVIITQSSWIKKNKKKF